MDCRFFFCGVLKGSTELLAIELLNQETGGNLSIIPSPVIHRHSNLKVCVQTFLHAFHESEGVLTLLVLFNLLSSRALLRRQELGWEMKHKIHPNIVYCAVGALRKSIYGNI